VPTANDREEHDPRVGTQPRIAPARFSRRPAGAQPSDGQLGYGQLGYGQSIDRQGSDDKAIGRHPRVSFASDGPPESARWKDRRAESSHVESWHVDGWHVERWEPTHDRRIEAERSRTVAVGRDDACVAPL
jgi:hypothetical protein